MIFIPCEKGISHNEIEKAEYEHVAAGANVLLRAVLEYDNRDTGREPATGRRDGSGTGGARRRGTGGGDRRCSALRSWRLGTFR